MAEASSLPHRSAPNEPQGLPPKHVRDERLTRLDECKDDSSIVADVIFVHGLQGHPWKTWRYKGPKTSRLPGFLKKKSPRTRVFWPRELLANDIPNVRIFTYGYDSKISHYTSGPANQSNISQHGLSLLTAVWAERLECPERPLVFVAHSLGGLLVKQALIESSKQAQDGRNRNLHKTCHAVIFFGTPHRGSGDASVGRIVVDIAAILQLDVNKSILRDLDPKSGSAILSTLLEDFNSLLMKEDIQVYTFQESAGKSGFGPFNGKVVPEESSSFGIRKIEQRDMINKNHMEMCRFASQDDEGYEKFLVALRGYVEAIKGKRQLAELEDERKGRKDLLQRLDYGERMVREKQIASTNASPLPSTFEWIWTTDKKPTSFRDWLADSEPVFWIQGKPGSGKSTLMDYLSTNNRVSQLLGTSGAEWTSIRFFFDFRSGTDIANTFEGLLRSLLLQMVKTVPGLETGLGQSSAKSYVPEHITKWDSRSLQDAFYRALAEFPTALCLFIDGLDEYGGQMFELVRFFFSISERCGPRARHKVCLASRPEEILAFGLEGCPGVRMQDHNTKGIEKYVRNMLDSRILPDEQDRDTFSELVAGKAEGVFLWARFAVSEVISSFSRGENLDELNRRLDEVPLEMNEIYYKIFGRMSPSDRHDARLMFQLVCFAKGSSVLSNGLTILQLKEAVDVANNRTVDPAHESRPSELQKFRRALRAKSGGLLEDVSESEEKLKNGRGDRGGSLVRLTHRTVKSYLDQEGWLLESQIENGSFSPHALWLYICCKHVQSILGPSKSRPRYTCADGRVPPDFLDPSMKHSLIQYASYSLFYHARYLERLSGESSYEHLSLVSSSLWMYLRDKCRPWKCYRLGDPDWDTIGRNPDIQPWQIVVEQGLTLCSGDVIKKALYAPRGDDEAISIALVIHGYTRDPALDAMNDSFNQLVTLLLEAGAVVSRTNVIMCLRYGTVSTLEVLLDYWYKGSIEANAVGFLSELTLRWGDEGFEPMLDLLLARGKDIIQVSGPGGNVFHTIIAMITKRSYQIRDINPRIRLLRERGANIKAPSTRGTPLQFAWRCFHSPELRSTLREELHEFMSVLVDNGADRYWREPNGAVVSMDDFLACCYLSLGQLESQSEFDHAFCRVSGDTYEYPLYATQSQIEEYTRSGGWPQ